MDRAEKNSAEQQTDSTVAQQLPRVIAISSGKGGVGKSSIAVNLGISLAKTGARVCIFDADTGLANVNILLGLSPQYSLEHVLFGAKSIEEVMMEGPHGLKIVPGANGISECVNLHPRQQLRLTGELSRIEKDFDYILVDTAAGISDTTLDFISASQHALVVITPEPTSLTDAFSLIKLLKRRRSRIDYHVVVNMCGNAGQAKEVFHRFAAAVEKYIGIQPEYLGYILRDESLRAAVTLQNPVALFPETDPSCSSFVRLADTLNRATAGEKDRPAFSAYWQKQFRNLGHKPEEVEEEKPAKESTEFSPEDRDNDYLSELRSRMLLMIEQGNAEAEQVAEVLQESVVAYIKRNESSPVDILAVVDQLIELSDQNEELLKEVYERVKPWGVGYDAPPTAEMMEGVSNQREEVSAPTLTPVVDVDSNATVPAANDVGESDTTESLVEVVANTVVDDEHSNKPLHETRVHTVDKRFGSQLELLEQLRRQQGRTVADWLSSLH